MANPSKAKGTEFESRLVNMLTARTGRTVRRLTLHGAKDIGDIEVQGWDVTIEAKTAKAVTLAAWVDETAVEKANRQTRWSALIFHRRGRPSAPYVVVPFDEWCEIMAVVHP